MIAGLWSFITDHATVIAAVVSAIAAVAVARYTAKLTKATTDQARLTREALELSQNEFNATHRPELIVHHVQFAMNEGEGNIRMGAGITYFNKGSSPAIILFRNGIIGRFSDILPHDITLPLISKKDETVPGGTSSFFGIDSQLAVNAVTQGFDSENIYCIGQIIYADGRDAIRQTGFCRKYDAATDQWVKTNENEYEYSY
jgi:hypothetical protein